MVQFCRQVNLTTMPRLFFSFILLSAVGCNVTKVSTTEREYATGATLFVQYAAEYRALCYQAYNVASWQLSALIEADADVRPAVVLDLDETVMDNSPYSGWQVLYDSAFSPASWKRWTDKAEAGLLPGALEFLHTADGLGATIFYVSNRTEDERESTLANLRNLGVPQAEHENLLLKTTTSAKDERRNAIEEQGYSILMLIGDNLGDVSGLFDRQSTERRAMVTDSLQHQFGRKYIVLPNPVYGEWERALYNYDNSLTPRERKKIRRERLRSFE